MWQNLEGELHMTTAALATALIAVTPVGMVLMERLAGLSRGIA
jgi:hypothetical protein